MPRPPPEASSILPPNHFWASSYPPQRMPRPPPEASGILPPNHFWASSYPPQRSPMYSPSVASYNTQRSYHPRVCVCPSQCQEIGAAEIVWPLFGCWGQATPTLIGCTGLHRVVKE